MQQLPNSVLITYPDGHTSVAPAFTVYRLEYADPFQRACSGFHTLEHIAWTIARIGHADLVCLPQLEPRS